MTDFDGFINLYDRFIENNLKSLCLKMNWNFSYICLSKSSQTLFATKFQQLSSYLSRSCISRKKANSLNKISEISISISSPHSFKLLLSNLLRESFNTDSSCLWNVLPNSCIRKPNTEWVKTKQSPFARTRLPGYQCNWQIHH